MFDIDMICDRWLLAVQERLGMNEYMARIELVMQADTKG